MSGDEKLLQFPTHFPVKVFGPNTDLYIQSIRDIVAEYFPKTREQDIQLKTSDNNNYVSITLNLYVMNQQELDAVYRALHGHADTKMVL